MHKPLGYRLQVTSFTPSPFHPQPTDENAVIPSVESEGVCDIVKNEPIVITSEMNSDPIIRELLEVNEDDLLDQQFDLLTSSSSADVPDASFTSTVNKMDLCEGW